MKNDIEHVLESLTPCRATAQLRSDVLRAVTDELTASRPTPRNLRRWDVRIGTAVAVSLILGIVLNVWAIRSDDTQQARLFGPARLPRQIRETVETAERVGGPECAELVRKQLVSAWQSRPREDPRTILHYRQQLVRRFLMEKGPIDAKEDSQVDGNWLGRPDRSALDIQCRFRVA